MDDALKKQAQEWFERGDHDLETAQLLYDERGHTDAIAYHIQQTIEKYLKGFLVLHGKKPPWIHELDRLLEAAAQIQPDLYPEFIELCERGTRYYVQDRYPPGPPADYHIEEIKADLDLARNLVTRIRTCL
jgi:HEPN domain-containing protein